MAYYTPEKHDSRRHESRWSKPLQSSTEDEHDVVLAEPRDQRPHHKPSQANREYGVATEDISETARWQQEGARDEREHTCGPCLCLRGNVEGLG